MPLSISIEQDFVLNTLRPFMKENEFKDCKIISQAKFRPNDKIYSDALFYTLTAHASKQVIYCYLLKDEENFYVMKSYKASTASYYFYSYRNKNMKPIKEHADYIVKKSEWNTCNAVLDVYVKYSHVAEVKQFFLDLEISKN